MLGRVSQYFERRRQLERCAKFNRDIERYRVNVLESKGLGDFVPEPFEHKRRRQVYIGKERVWKFYRTSRRDARNFIAGSKILEEAGIVAPKVEYSDVARETKDEYRLCCVIMDRLRGREFGHEGTPEQIQALAGFLARLNSVRSEKWGECHDPKTSGYFEDYFIERMQVRLGLIDDWLAEKGLGQRPDVIAWFNERREDLLPAGGQYCMVSADAHLHNFFIDDETGELSLIDLDRSRFLDFPVDLVEFLPRDLGMSFVDEVSSSRELIERLESESQDFLRAYFAAAPPEFEGHWKRVREAHVLYLTVLDLWWRLRRTEVKFSLFKSPDLEALEKQARAKLKVLELIVGGEG